MDRLTATTSSPGRGSGKRTASAGGSTGGQGGFVTCLPIFTDIVEQPNGRQSSSTDAQRLELLCLWRGARPGCAADGLHALRDAAARRLRSARLSSVGAADALAI